MNAGASLSTPGRLKRRGLAARPRFVALAALLLSGCAALPSVVLPERGDCVANGVTVTITFPNGKTSEGAGCVEERPYPGMERPGHD
ncbi:hypothetical protein UFOVP134_21 [uncultured Caudovirales phage]|uniref:Lipoprotein n=1 Tax=uncultured Caudovirales phage TaxID=2100421 RepID=A0A6J5LBU7_9CAUD|nr:hypothetical protein UFOVP134_21 [uncultured Caudovirales phage]